MNKLIKITIASSIIRSSLIANTNDKQIKTVEPQDVATTVKSSSSEEDILKKQLEQMIKPEIKVVKKMNFDFEKNLKTVLGNLNINNVEIDTIMEFPNNSLFLIVINKDDNKKYPFFSNIEGTYISAYRHVIGKNGIVKTKEFEEKINEILKHNKEAEAINKISKDLEIFETMMKSRIKDNVIKINMEKEHSIVMFMDPLCPYCQQKAQDIEKIAEEFNIYMVMTPLGLEGENVTKSAFIQQEFVKHKDDSRKQLDITKTYMSKKKLTESEEKSIQTKYFDIVKDNSTYMFRDKKFIQGTPYIIILENHK